MSWNFRPCHGSFRHVMEISAISCKLRPCLVKFSHGISVACYAISLACYAISLAWYAISLAWYAISLACYAISLACYAISLACYTISLACYDISLTCYAISLACYAIRMVCYAIRMAFSLSELNIYFLFWTFQNNLFYIKIFLLIIIPEYIYTYILVSEGLLIQTGHSAALSIIRDSGR